jgi:hypothetical protein
MTAAIQTPAPAIPRAAAGPSLPPVRVGDSPNGRPKKTARGEGPTSRMTEAQLLQAVRDLAKLTGWETYHTHNSRRSEPGWPDLVCANAKQRRVLFVELKTATGSVSKHQEKWLALLAACGQEAAVWRPADLEEVARVLRGKRIGDAA